MSLSEPSLFASSEWTPLYCGRGMVFDFDHDLFALLDAAATAQPDCAALSLGDQTLSYGDLNTQSTLLAGWLLSESGLKAGDRVALYLPNSLSYLIAIYAAWRAGMIVVNLGLAHEQAQVLYQLQDSGSKLLFTVPKLLPKVQGMLLDTSVRHVVTTQPSDHDGFGRRVAQLLSPARWVRQLKTDRSLLNEIRLRRILNMRLGEQDWPLRQPDDVAMIQYTSGTTGRPKGSTLTHRNLVANAQQSRRVLGEHLLEGERLLSPVSMQHVLGLGFVLLGLSMRSHVILANMQELTSNTALLAQANPHALLGVPMLYDHLLRTGFDPLTTPHLRLFLCGASPASRILQEKWHALTGKYLCEGYGMSETSPVIAASPPERIRIGTVGVILPNTDVRVMSAAGRTVGFNEAGELWVRGPQVMRGYWQHPGATLEVMTHDGWFCTGDIVSVDSDGYLSMLERKKDVFWVQNQMIFPTEVEHAAATHEDVLDCVAIQDSSQPRQPVRLYVVAREGLTKDVLHRHLTRHLQHIELPDQIEFVDHLPRGPMGKLLRRLVRDRSDNGSRVSRSSRADRPASPKRRSRGFRRGAAVEGAEATVAAEPLSLAVDRPDDDRPPSDDPIVTSTDIRLDSPDDKSPN
jgi:long-chain acyl-CoA synthetase